MILLLIGSLLLTGSPLLDRTFTDTRILSLLPARFSTEPLSRSYRGPWFLHSPRFSLLLS